MTDIQAASRLASLARALATSTKRPGPVRALTPVSLALPRVVLDAQHIARYAAVCGLAPAAQVPLTYPQMLTFELVMHHLTSEACPWPAMGTVHLANAITQHAPLAAGDAVRVELQTGELLAHEKGQAFTLHLRVLREDDGVCAWQATQTLLRVGVPSPVGPPLGADVHDGQALARLGGFDAPADIGRRYAAVSGDYNPIHLWPVTARLLGFRRAIAHGLWTQARALALLLPDGVCPQATLRTVFKRPLLLPAQATVWQAGLPDKAQLFEVRDAAGQMPHLRARLIPHPHTPQP
ncbi:MAG: acyl dehydratase [Betaproteobacteria bacterium]|nr:acyl dehydratase [Betaproteobacteria bacterium]